MTELLRRVRASVATGTANRLARLGIRARLVALVLAMLVPWIAMFATTILSYRRDRDRETRARLSDLAFQVSARVDDQVEAADALLLAVAQAVATDSAGRASNDALLRRLHAELPPYFHNLAVWAADGRNVGTSEGPGSGANQMEVAAHRFFRQALGRRDLTVGRPIRTGPDADWSLTIARSIQRDGAAVGVVTATARLDGLTRLLEAGDDMPPGTVITLVDDRGILLARTAEAERWIGREVLGAEQLRQLRIRRSTLRERDGLDGVPRLVAHHVVPRVQWMLLVALPRDSDVLGGEAQWRYLTLFGALGLGGALFLAALVAARIADPVRKLTADAARLGAGDLSARTDVLATGEIGTLASTFNQMASTLQTRTAALAASEERHRLAARATNDVIWDWDVTTSRVEWSEAATSLFRLDPGDLGATIEWWQDRIHPEDRDRTVSSLTDALDSDTSFWTAEYRFRAGDGRYAEILDRGYLTRDATGAPQRMISSMLDLTERRAAERERDRFFSLSADMFCIASRDGRLLRVNPACCDALGYTADELQAIPVLELVHPADRESVLDAARRFAAGEPSQRFESRFCCRNGKMKWLSCTVHSSGSEQGLVYAVARDVTDEKRAEDRLRASEEWYRLLFEANPLPMWVYDIETLAFLAVNEAAVEHYGYSRGEFLDMRITDIRPEEDVPKVLAAARSPRSPQFNRGTWRHRKKDGTIILAEVVTHEITVLDRPARLTLAQDVTEQKRAERALRETNDTLQTLIQASPLAIVTTDGSGTVTEWNVAAERMFGWVAGDVIGRALPIVPAAQLDDDMRRLAVSGEHSFSGYETRCARNDGTLVDVYVSSAALRGAGGVLGMMWVMADVTERKAIEEQLRQAQKMDAVGQLAGGVAHDFNNLLTVITSYGQFLLNALPEQDPRHADAGQITHAAARAASLTRQLLAFSRRQVLQPQILDLNEVIGDMQKLLRRVISENISLATQFEHGLGPVRADRGQIEQVVMNLVVNARDAMPSGGTLSISTRGVHLDAAYARRRAGVTPGRHVVLAVRDTGIGMDAATQSRIFEPFFTTKETGKGTGLGLSTVYGIVRQSGGHLEVRSVPGRGTVFEIYLPQVAAAALHRAEAVVESPALPAGDETVLVVEDEDAVRLIVRRVLRGQGYHILEARDGHEALRLCNQHNGSIQLVLTDVIMPGMGGRELARNLASTRPGLPVLFMSGYTDDGALAGASLEPGSPFLAKPFTAEALARTVRDVLDAGAGSHARRAPKASV